MIKNFSEATELVESNLKKYRLAGISFLVLNVLYIIIAWWKMPPVDLAMSKVVYGGFVVFFILVLILFPLILRGKRLLVQVLAFIYGGRMIFSLYFLIGGDRKRLGIIASKKIGNAVARNLTKRKIREVFRHIKGRIEPAMDIVIISGRDLASLPVSVIEKKIFQSLPVKSNL